MATLELQPEFAYVMIVFVLSIFQLFWMASKVGAARKKYDVKVNGCGVSVRYLLTLLCVNSCQVDKTPNKHHEITH